MGQNGIGRIKRLTVSNHSHHRPIFCFILVSRLGRGKLSAPAKLRRWGSRGREVGSRLKRQVLVLHRSTSSLSRPCCVLPVVGVDLVLPVQHVREVTVSRDYSSPSPLPPLLFPLACFVSSLERLQEERRLGYVALTRASKNAIITFSKKRRFQNAWVNSAGPSRYIVSFICLRVAVSLQHKLLSSLFGRGEESED